MEVNLKSDGWYNKLQEFVLGDAKPDLFSLCPYFWLTIFCIIALPFAVLIKIGKFVARRIKRNLIDPIFDNFKHENRSFRLLRNILDKMNFFRCLFSKNLL